MIKLRHQQPSLWHKGLAKDIEDLWEPWMKEVDQLLEDAAFRLYQAQSDLVNQSRVRVAARPCGDVSMGLLDHHVFAPECIILRREPYKADP